MQEETNLNQVQLTEVAVLARLGHYQDEGLYPEADAYAHRVQAVHKVRKAVCSRRNTPDGDQSSSTVSTGASVLKLQLAQT